MPKVERIDSTLKGWNRMSELSNKVILVTGALGKIGASAVHMFLKKGAKVVANDILDVEEFPEISSLQDQYENRFLFVKANTSEEEQVKRMIEEIDNKFGILNGLFHNAYTQIRKTATDLSLEEWDSVMKGSLTSTFLINKYTLPLMIKAGEGSIVNTSSVLSYRPQETCLAYGAAKAGINQFTRVIAVDYAKDNIRANVIMPGDIKTEEQIQAQPDKSRQFMEENTLIGRSGVPDEISALAAFLLSDAASYLTGSLYSADGGYKI